MNNLLKFEIEEMNKIMKEQVTGFVVDSIDKANWCFRKLQSLKEAIAENDRLADAEIQRIEAWREKENKSHEEAIEHFETMLTQYFKDLRAMDPKAKLSTPYGKVTARKTKKWNYEDDKVIAWAKENEIPVIKVTESLQKAELKKLFPEGVNTDTGELIEGVTIEEVESISIKLD